MSLKRQTSSEQQSAIDWDNIGDEPSGKGPAKEWKVERWMLLCVMMLAVFVRARTAAETQQLDRDPQKYLRIAELLAQRGEYRDTYSATWNPTAQRPPLYPLLLAPCARLLAAAGLAVVCLHTVISAWTIWLVWRLGCRWNLPPFAALLAAVLIAIDPILINRSVNIASETLATLLVVLALGALTSFSERPAWHRAAWVGASLSSCALCQSVLLAWLASVLVLLPFVLGSSHTREARLRWTAAGLVGAGIVLAPWMVRNKLQLGEPIVTNTRGGLTLLLGNNPLYYEHLREQAWEQPWDANSFESDWRRQQRTLGNDEVLQDHLAYSRAWENIRNEPGMFVLSCAIRLGSLWGLVPPPFIQFEGQNWRVLRYAIGAFYAFEFLLAALAAWQIGRGLASLPWVWGATLVASFTLVGMFFGTSLYERAPLMPVLSLLAAAGLAQIWAERRPIKLLT